MSTVKEHDQRSNHRKGWFLSYVALFVLVALVWRAFAAQESHRPVRASETSESPSQREGTSAPTPTERSSELALIDDPKVVDSYRNAITSSADQKQFGLTSTQAASTTSPTSLKPLGSTHGAVRRSSAAALTKRKPALAALPQASTITIARSSNPRSRLGSVSQSKTTTNGSTDTVAPTVLSVVPGETFNDALPAGQFQISGRALSILRPGTFSDVGLTITNSNNFPISIDSLTVSFVGTPGCEGPTNFRVFRPFNGPFIAAPGTTAIPTAMAPRIQMIDLPVPQDACKTTTITLHYAGSATKS